MITSKKDAFFQSASLIKLLMYRLRSCCKLKVKLLF